MTTLEALKAARELIADETRWTQETNARDAKGRPIDPTDEDACRWCAYGALVKVSGQWNPVPLFALARGVGAHSFAVFNDSHTHAEVIAAFDKGIAAEEQAVA